MSDKLGNDGWNLLTTIKIKDYESFEKYFGVPYWLFL
jgi:hypothetical protein